MNPLFFVFANLVVISIFFALYVFAGTNLFVVLALAFAFMVPMNYIMYILAKKDEKERLVKEENAFNTFQKNLNELLKQKNKTGEKYLTFLKENRPHWALLNPASREAFVNELKRRSYEVTRTIGKNRVTADMFGDNSPGLHDELRPKR